jgi:hypothetical protein
LFLLRNLDTSHLHVSEQAFHTHSLYSVLAHCGWGVEWACEEENLSFEKFPVCGSGEGIHIAWGKDDCNPLLHTA